MAGVTTTDQNSWSSDDHTLNGRVFNSWRVVSYAFRVIHKREGRTISVHRRYNVECTNCGAKTVKNLCDMRRMSCHNCSMMGQNESGMLRLFGEYKKVAERNGRSFDLTTDQFRKLTSSSCFYCGAPPTKVKACNQYSASKSSTWGDYTYNGIDRKNNELGYTRTNSIPCCVVCNRAKNAMSYAEFVKYWTDIYTRIGSNPSELMKAHAKRSR